MAFERVAFPALPWTQGGHPLEKKKAWQSGTGRSGVTLLELAAGFEDPNLCRNGHFIYVVEGSLELILETGSERLTAGEACFLDPGTIHRALNPGQEIVHLIVLAL